MTRVYLDTSSIVYLVEAENPLYETARRRVNAYKTASDTVFITSQIARLECRTKPMRDGDLRTLADYDAFFSMVEVEVFDVTGETADIAAGLRARQGFKTPDAIQLATAVQHRADVVLTGDKEWPRFKEIPVEILSSSSG